MRIAKGIKGIRKIINEDRKGWHVYNETVNLGYYDLTFKEMLRRHPTSTLIGIAGNTIAIEKSI